MSVLHCNMQNYLASNGRFRPDDESHSHMLETLASVITNPRKWELLKFVLWFYPAIQELSFLLARPVYRLTPIVTIIPSNPTQYKGTHALQHCHDMLLAPP